MVNKRGVPFGPTWLTRTLGHIPHHPDNFNTAPPIGCFNFGANILANNMAKRGQRRMKKNTANKSVAAWPGPCRTEFSDVGFDFIVVGTNKI